MKKLIVVATASVLGASVLFAAPKPSRFQMVRRQIFRPMGRQRLNPSWN